MTQDDMDREQAIAEEQLADAARQAQLEDIRKLRSQLQGLNQANASEMMAVAQLGAQIDPASVLAIRLDSFIEYVFARMGNVSDEVRQILTLQFEVLFCERLAGMLKNTKSEVRKAQLGLGAQVSQADIERAWKARHGNGGPPGGGLIRP